MLLTSIYGHFRRLKLSTEHATMCRVGLIVRDLYLAQYGTLPPKKRRMIKDHIMWVFVYPEEFTRQVVKAIRQDQACQPVPAPAVNTPAPQAPPTGAKRQRMRIRSMQQVYSTAKTGERKQ
jgi:hypothetical protein